MRKLLIFIFVLIYSISFVVVVVACDPGVISKKVFLNLRSQRFTALFSSKDFLAAAHSFSSVLHFDLVFVDGDGGLWRLSFD